MSRPKQQKILRVPRAIFDRYWPTDDDLSGACQAVIDASDLPRGSKVVNVSLYPLADGNVYIKVEHESFDDVGQMDRFPIVDFAGPDRPTLIDTSHFPCVTSTE